MRVYSAVLSAIFALGAAGCGLSDKFQGLPINDQDMSDAQQEDLSSMVDDMSTLPIGPDMLIPGVGSTRCKVDDHSVLQTLDNTGQWVNSPCPMNTVCTDLHGTCIDPMWTQWSYAAPLPTPRFTTVSGVGGEDIVKDALTGLSWQLKLPDATYTQPNAVAYCSALTYGGFADWRLATSTELNTIIDRRIAPASMSTSPPTVQTPFAAYTAADVFWSSVLYPGNLAFAISFGSGVQNSFMTSESHRARCVR